MSTKSNADGTIDTLLPINNLIRLAKFVPRHCTSDIKLISCEIALRSNRLIVSDKGSYITEVSTTFLKEKIRTI